MRYFYKDGTLSPKQKKIASAAEPRDKITGADFAALRSDRAMAKKGGSMYHTTKDGRKARKGLWYNIMMKRKRGAKMRKKGEKGAPTAAAIKKSQGK
jgi:hypothetical protein